MLTHFFAWKNNPKRETLYKRECRVLAYGKKNSVMVEFENGQIELVSRNSIKPIKGERMAETRRSYRTTAVEEPEQERTPAPPREEKPKKTEGNSQYINITGLFPSKSGKADTVFLTAEHCEALKALKPGDVLGVSVNKKTQRLALWAIPNEEE
jgi:hypothetical protein